MIKLSDEAKAYYSRYIGADGKFVIDDSLPDEVKETFAYFNDNNINIMTLNVDESKVFSDDVEELESDADDEFVDDDSFDDVDNGNSTVGSNPIVEDGNVNVDDLNDLF